jgi:hypothetical protein
VLYLVAIVVATLRYTWIAQGIFVAAALIWLVSDRRMKRVLQYNRSNVQIMSQTGRRFCLSECKETDGSEMPWGRMESE